MPEHHLGFDPDMSNVGEEDRRPSHYHEKLKRDLNRMVQEGTDGTPEGLEIHKAVDTLEQEIDEKQI